MSLLQCVAQRVGQAEAHCRQAMQAVTAFTAAGVDLREVEVHGMRQDRDALERNHVLLLAEDAYFVACLCTTVTRNEVHALLAALTPMLPAVSAFSSARTDSLAAHGLFFACLAALDRRKLRGDDVTALLQSEWFVTPDNALARAALRMAAAVASTAGHEAAIAAACTDGCFACLLSVLQSQVRASSLCSLAHVGPLTFLPWHHSCACRPSTSSPPTAFWTPSSSTCAAAARHVCAADCMQERN